MKLDILEFLEKRLANLIEKPLEAFFPTARADQILAKRLVQAMSDDLSVDRGGQLVAPVCYELRINPLHSVLWAERPGLVFQLTEALVNAAREQSISFERPPVIDVVFDSEISPEDIRVTTLELGIKGATKSGNPLELPDITTAVPADAFLIINGDRHLALTQPVLTIGRAASNHLVLDYPEVSRMHAQLRVIDGAFCVFDLDSTCGTLVNGESIKQYKLRSGDVLDIGGVTLIYGQESGWVEDTTDLPAIDPENDDSE